jgi:hypothetical protein
LEGAFLGRTPYCPFTIAHSPIDYQRQDTDLSNSQKRGLRNRFRLVGEKIGGLGRKKFGTIVAQPYFCTPFDENVRIAR